jgi:glycosyltransferase involved in cell wall biosynthesis
VCASLNEGFGLAILEAMACGCPIVSTVDIGQVGPKVRPKDAKALATAIRSYLDNPRKAAADGKKNAALARGHTWDDFYRSFEKIYNDLNKHRSK